MKFSVNTDWSDGVPRAVGYFTTDEGKRLGREELEKLGRLFLAAEDLYWAARCALADLEGFVADAGTDMPNVEATIEELRNAIAKAERKDE